MTPVQGLASKPWPPAVPMASPLQAGAGRPAGDLAPPRLAPHRPAGAAGPRTLAPRALLPHGPQGRPGWPAAALPVTDAALARRGADEARGLREAVSLQGFDLAAAVACDWRAQQAPPGDAGEAAERIHRQRTILECMRACAECAYHPARQGLAEIGCLRPLADLCSDMMKAWAAESPQGLTLVLAMAGTRLDLADVAMDVASHHVSTHVNALDPTLPSLQAVGAGWSRRWTLLAGARRAGAQSLAELLACSAVQCARRGQVLQVMLTGHSMGGAVATLAGYDIAHVLARQGVQGQTCVHAFNPPRLGEQSACERYRMALSGQSAAGHAAAPALALRQLTRKFDPVSSLPARLHHPLWHAPAEPAAAGTLHAPGSLDLVRNHDIKAWRHVIATMPADRVARLFDRPTASSGAAS